MHIHFLCPFPFWSLCYTSTASAQLPAACIYHCPEKGPTCCACWCLNVSACSAQSIVHVGSCWLTTNVLSADSIPGGCSIMQCSCGHVIADISQGHSSAEARWPASSMFSLGALLFQLATGDLPFSNFLVDSDSTVYCAKKQFALACKLGRPCMAGRLLLVVHVQKSLPDRLWSY